MSLPAGIIQGIGFLGTVLFFLSFQFKKNQTLFRVQLASYILYTLHLFCLGAATGALSYVLNTVRSFCLGSRSRFLKSRTMCVILCAMQLAVLCFTWAGWISILPIAANIATTIGGYSKNPRTIRLSTIFINSPLWMIYSILVGSWAGILDEVVTEASAIISILRFGWKELGKTEPEENDSTS